MSTTVTVYGTSDDLIEVEGAVTEEFDAFDTGMQYLVFNEGTVLSIEYGSIGCWQIRRVRDGTAAYTHVAHDNDDTTYSDRVTLRGDLRFVALHETLPPAQPRHGTNAEDAAKWRLLCAHAFDIAASDDAADSIQLSLKGNTLMQYLLNQLRADAGQ